MTFLKDARHNAHDKRWATIEAPFSGKHISGTLLEEYADGTVTINFSRAPWRGKLVRIHRGHPDLDL